MPKPLALPPLHVVQVYDLADGRPVAGKRQVRPTAQAARVLGESLALAHAGVLVWSQTAGDNGEYGEPEILLRLGVTPG